LSKEKELKYLSLATTYEVDDSFDSDKFIKLRLRICHDGVNPNHSSFQVDSMENAKESIYNIPILANVIFDEDGNPQFGGHDMELEDSKITEGETKLIYKESPIGVVPENCNYVIDKFNNKNYAFADCYVWKGYSNYAQDIIERDKDIKLSMEILVDEYSYNAKEKVFNISNYRYQGITFLNKNYGTGMEKAMATTGTFQEDNVKEKFVLLMEELKQTLENYSIKNGGGSEVADEVKVPEVAPEDIVQDEKFVKSFELSHEDVRYALYQLLAPIESEDNEWYFIDRVYDDKFEYENWEGTKIFRQGYKKEGDVVSFEGDRVELFDERLTKEEKEALDKMRAEYSQFKADFETLKTDKEQFETSFNDLNSNYEQVKTELENTQKALNELSEYKLKKERDEKDKVFAKFEGLTEDDIKSIREKIDTYSLTDLEDKLLVVWAKKRMEYERFKKENGQESDKDKLIFALANVNTVPNNDNAPIYADIITKYNK
jgi:hypothetical protein